MVEPWFQSPSSDPWLPGPPLGAGHVPPDLGTRWPFPPDPVLPQPRARRHRANLALVLVVSVLAAVVATAASAVVEAPASAPVITFPGDVAGRNGGIVSAGGASSSVASAAAADRAAVVVIDTQITVRAVGFRRAREIGIGSGFIYTPNGYILTAAHVVEGTSRVIVTLADGRTFRGIVAARDLALDVAVVKIAATGLPTLASGNSADLTVGEIAAAIGDPLGKSPGSVTTGVVSSLDVTVTVTDQLTGRPRTLTGLVQTNAPIYPGNSGGPLIDASGAAIGIVSAASSSTVGIGFAVPINAAAHVIAAAGGS